MNHRHGLAALIVGLAAHAAHADVRWSIPFAARVAAAKTIAVARVTKVEGSPPFTVGHAPRVTLEVTRAIRGCKLHDRLHLDGFGAEQPPWADVQTPPRNKDEPVQAPNIGSEFLILTPPGEGSGPRGFMERALYASPDPQQIEKTIALATFHYDLPQDDTIRSVIGGPAVVTLQLTNDTAAKATFDQAKLRFTTRPPGAFDDVSASPPPALLSFRPHETRTITWDLAKLVPTLFTSPGDYYVRMELPAAGARDFLDLHIERLERSSAFLCGRAQVIARARVDAIAAGKLTLADVIALRGDPAGLATPARPLTLPAWNSPPAVGKRAVICWHDGAPEWVEGETEALRDQILRSLEGDTQVALPADARFVPKEELPASELHKIELRMRFAVP